MQVEDLVDLLADPDKENKDPLALLRLPKKSKKSKKGKSKKHSRGENDPMEPFRDALSNLSGRPSIRLVPARIPFAELPISGRGLRLL